VMISARSVLNRLTPLAVTSRARNPAYPDVPTVGESGGPESFEMSAWSTLMAHADTPKPVLQKVYADVIRAMQAPGVRKLTADLGFDIGGRSPEQTAEFIRSEARVYRELVDVAKLQRDQ